MSDFSASSLITQYGVQTPTSNVILIVTTERAAAEQALEWITDGRIVARTITYGGWQLTDDTGDLAMTG